MIGKIRTLFGNKRERLAYAILVLLILIVNAFVPFFGWKFLLLSVPVTLVVLAVTFLIVHKLFIADHYLREVTSLARTNRARTLEQRTDLRETDIRRQNEVATLGRKLDQALAGVKQLREKSDTSFHELASIIRNAPLGNAPDARTGPRATTQNLGESNRSCSSLTDWHAYFASTQRDSQPRPPKAQYDDSWLIHHELTPRSRSLIGRNKASGSLLATDVVSIAFFTSEPLRRALGRYVRDVTDGADVLPDVIFLSDVFYSEREAGASPALKDVLLDIRELRRTFDHPIKIVFFFEEGSPSESELVALTTATDLVVGYGESPMPALGEKYFAINSIIDVAHAEELLLESSYSMEPSRLDEEIIVFGGLQFASETGSVNLAELFRRILTGTGYSQGPRLREIFKRTRCFPSMPFLHSILTRVGVENPEHRQVTSFVLVEPEDLNDGQLKNVACLSQFHEFSNIVFVLSTKFSASQGAQLGEMLRLKNSSLLLEAALMDHSYSSPNLLTTPLATVMRASSPWDPMDILNLTEVAEIGRLPLTPSHRGEKFAICSVLERPVLFSAHDALVVLRDLHDAQVVRALTVN